MAEALGAIFLAVLFGLLRTVDSLEPSRESKMPRASTHRPESLHIFMFTRSMSWAVHENLLVQCSTEATCSSLLALCGTFVCADIILLLFAHGECVEFCRSALSLSGQRSIEEFVFSDVRLLAYASLQQIQWSTQMRPSPFRGPMDQEVHGAYIVKASVLFTGWQYGSIGPYSVLFFCMFLLESDVERFRVGCKPPEEVSSNKRV